MDAIQQQQMAQAGRRSLERRLLQVKAALAAWQRGEYGECQSCGAEISYARLKARPESPLCLDCQSASEAGPGPS
jgi:DnaK suppressor protein